MGKSQLKTVGRVGAPFGVQGWVRVHSFTSPLEQLLSYQPWMLKTAHGLKAIELEDAKAHGTGLVVKFVGIDDREKAKTIGRCEIATDSAQFPALDEEEFYWHQLEDLRVLSIYNGIETPLGCVTSLLETGANDVLVVKGAANSEDAPSIDNRERLIPYIPEQVIKQIDLDQGLITVDWDPEF